MAILLDYDTVFRSERARDKIASYLGAGNRVEEYRSGTLVVDGPAPEAFTMRMFAEADRNDIAAITRGDVRVAERVLSRPPELISRS